MKNKYTQMRKLIRNVSSWLVFGLIGITFLIACNAQHKQQDNLPNIIIMLADDLGYNDLSCYRDKEQISEFTPTCQTPFIDNLAKEGIRFTNFYSGATVCSPSRAALMTGRNKTRLGIYNWIPANSPMHLKDKETTIAEMLRQKDYSTAHFGKWHLTSENMGQPRPLEQGFDYAFWTYNNAKPSHKNPVNFMQNNEKLGELKGYSSHLVIDNAMKWLEGRENMEKPFYMNIWFHEPHSPTASPDSLMSRHERNKSYYGCIENMDYAVGKLLKYLKDNNLIESTIILFSSDNGSVQFGSNAPFRGEKTLQYEGGIRVPFIAFWKNHIKEGVVSNATGHFTDVLPTLASVTKCETTEINNIDGISLADVFLGKSKDFKRNAPVFFYRYASDPICMLREGNMVLLGYQNPPKPRQEKYDKLEEALIKPKEGQNKWAEWSFSKGHMDALLLQKPKYFELYNVKEDPGQFNEISTKHPEMTDEMKNTMVKLRDQMVLEGGNWFNKE